MFANDLLGEYPLMLNAPVFHVVTWPFASSMKIA